MITSNTKTIFLILIIFTLVFADIEMQVKVNKIQYTVKIIGIYDVLKSYWLTYIQKENHTAIKWITFHKSSNVIDAQDE